MTLYRNIRINNASLAIPLKNRAVVVYITHKLMSYVTSMDCL